MGTNKRGVRKVGVKDTGIDVGEVLADPTTFCQSGPLRNPIIAQILESAQTMQPRIVGDLVKSRTRSLTNEALGEMVRKVVEFLSPDEIGRFMIGRAVDRLNRQ